MTHRKLLRFLFGLVAVAVAVGTLVPGAGRWLPFYAPLATHVAAFTLVGALARLSMPASRWGIPVAWAMALGIAVETLQLVVPGRAFAVRDLLANLVGSGLGILVGAIVLVIAARTGLATMGDAKAVEPD